MVAARVLRDTGFFVSIVMATALRVLVDLSLAALLLVLCSRSLGGNGTLELRGLSNALALLALAVLLGNLRAVVCIAIGEALLLARSLVEALGLAAGIGL
jgi:hypothetical protein